MVVAPALIGLTPKSRDPRIEDDVIRSACIANIGVDRLMPVFLRQEQLGWTIGDRASSVVNFFPQRRSIDKYVTAGISGFDDIVAAQAAGRRLAQWWSKAYTGTVVISNWYDLWPVSGNPLSGTYVNTAATLRQHSDADTGALATGGAVGPTYFKFCTYIVANASAGTVQPMLVMYDRVAVYEACAFNTGTATSMTNTLAAQRYISSGQQGLLVMMTVGSTALSTTQQYLSAMTYVDQTGTSSTISGLTATNCSIIPSAAVASATVGARVISPSVAAANTLTAGYQLPLLNGDTGVRSITSYTNGGATANTGKMYFVLIRPLATIALGAAGAPSEKDLVSVSSGLTQVFDGACVVPLVMFPVATAATFTGELTFVWN